MSSFKNPDNLYIMGKFFRNSPVMYSSSRSTPISVALWNIAAICFASCSAFLRSLLLAFAPLIVASSLFALVDGRVRGGLKPLGLKPETGWGAGGGGSGGTLSLSLLRNGIPQMLACCGANSFDPRSCMKVPQLT